MSHEDVQQILSLIDQLDKSGFTYVRLETGDFKLVLSKVGLVEPVPEVVTAQAGLARAVTAGASGNVDVTDRADTTTRADAPAKGEPEAAEAGLVPIRAPMVGRFYVAPEPGAPSFVSEGSRVDEETTVGLIEVMKVFSAVKAGVKGVIARVCVEDGQFVEYGQPLFLVQPEDTAGHRP